MMISKFRNLLFWVRSWIPCHCCERGVFKWDHLPANGKLIQHPKLFNKNKLFHISANQKIKILQRLWICFTKQKKTEKQHWPWHKTNSPVYNFYTAWQLLVYSCKSFWYFLLNLSSKNDANHHESHADWLLRGFLWDSHQIGIKLCTII